MQQLDGQVPIRIGIVEDGFMIPDDPQKPDNFSLYEFYKVRMEPSGNFLTLKLPEVRPKVLSKANFSDSFPLTHIFTLGVNRND